MSWSRAQYEKSLAEWQEKEARYRRNWRSKKKGDPRRYFWFKLLKKAVLMVDERKRQISALAPGGISDAGLALIKGFEGFRSKPYRDAVGVWTIGYGETRGVSRFTRPWSEKHAADALRTRADHDYYPAVRDAARAGGVKLNQHQVDALTSFVYNLGAGILGADTTVGRALRSGSIKRTADAILLYDKAGGHALQGLTRRRKAEHDLFLKK